MATQYQKLPVPGFVSPTATYTDPEIMYSMQGYTQKGVTLAAGQGVLPAGLVVGQRTATKRYAAYSNAAGDGTQTARGILRRAVDTGTDPAGPAQLGNIVIRGIVKRNAVTGLDAAALTDLGGVEDTVLNTLKL